MEWVFQLINLAALAFCLIPLDLRSRPNPIHVVAITLIGAYVMLEGIAAIAGWGQPELPPGGDSSFEPNMNVPRLLNAVLPWIVAWIGFAAAVRGLVGFWKLIFRR
jgi:hypothetical protein